MKGGDNPPSVFLKREMTMKIYDNLKEMSLIQCLITLQTWYYRLNKQWNRLVRDNGAKYDWLRVPAVIFAIATLFLVAYVPAEALAVGSAESHNIWVAYTVGDVSFTHSVLRAISMMMYGGGGVIQGAYRLAALLGIIWLIVRGIFSKDGLNLGSGLFVILFYMCFFVPQSTLHIEDMQTKKYYTMDKIPLGVSASLSVVSKIGKYLSESYETVFVDVASDNGLCTTGAMECNGYLGTLDLLVKARSSLQNSAAYLAINQSLCHSNTDYSNCDIETSLVNYVRDCTIHKVTNPNERFSLKNVKAFTNNADTSSEMRYHSERHLVNVYLGKGKTGTKTCKDAGTYIEQAFNDAKVKSTIFKLASPAHNMNPHDGGVVTDGGTGFDNGTTTGRENTAALQGMMDEALTGLGGSTADSYEYLRNVIMQPLIEEGMKAGYVDQNMMAARITLETAIAQRDLQLAAESSMFATMVRPLSTFLEGFVLALTPIMPFIILISVNGFAICMKYLMVLLWIQLWAPALSICNMYVQNVTRENLAIALVGTDITSLAGISRATPIIQHWLAVGGMMGASVPVLTLFILSGSIYTFNSLATSMKGSDHFDEKAIQPDAIKKSAYINDSVGSLNASSGGGVIEADTQGRYKSFSQLDAFEAVESQAHTELIQKGNEFTEAIMNSLSHTKNGQITRQFLENYGKASQASDAISYNKTRGMVKNLLDKYHFSTDEKTTDLITAGLQFRAHAGVETEIGTPGWIKAVAGADAKIKAGADFEGKASYDHSWLDQQVSGFANEVSTAATEQINATKTKTSQDTFLKNLTSAIQHTGTDEFKESDAHNINRTYKETKSAADNYQKASDRKKTSSATKNMSSNQIAAQFLQYGNRQALNEWYDKTDINTKRKIDNIRHQSGMADNDTGFIAAITEFAFENRKNDENAREASAIIGLSYIMPGHDMDEITNNLHVNPDGHEISAEGANFNSNVRANSDGVSSYIETNDQQPGVNEALIDNKRTIEKESTALNNNANKHGDAVTQKVEEAKRKAEEEKKKAEEEKRRLTAEEEKRRLESERRRKRKEEEREFHTPTVG